jgi:hypothetical protein
MKTLTWEQAADWATAVGLHATVTRHRDEYESDDGTRSIVQRITKELWFPDEKPDLRWRLPLPRIPYQVTYLANALLPYSDDKFRPCLLWLTDFGFWSEVSERVAKSLVASFRAERGDPRPLIETPGHLFGEREEVDAQTLLTLATVFGWDCYVIPQHGEYYALNSHDEYLDVVSRNAAVQAALERKIKKRWGSR